MSIDHGKVLALVDRMERHAERLPAEAAKMLRHYIAALRALAQPAEAVDGREPVVWRVPTKYGIGYSFASEEVMRELCGPAEAVEAKWVTDLRNEAVRGSMKDVYWLSRDQVFELIGDASGRKSPAHHDVVVTRPTDAAQGAVAEVYAGAFGIHYIACADPNKLPVGTKLYTHPQAAPAQAGWLHASIIREAGDVLEAVGASGVSLPDNWRWPLADELHGIAAMAAAPAQGVPEGWRIVREANGDLTLEKDGIAPYIRQRFHARHMLHGFLSAILAAAPLQEPQS